MNGLSKIQHHQQRNSNWICNTRQRSIWLSDAKYNIFTNRTEISYMKTIPKTLELLQAQGDKGEGWVDGGDKLWLKLFMCIDLKLELKSRCLLRSGLKVDLVSWTKTYLESERGDFVTNDADGEEDAVAIITTTTVITVLDGTL